MSKNVLIVDDSATMRQMVRRTLQLSALCVDEVFEASNGIEALAVMAEHPVTVLLLDINMPTMNGIQLLTRMKENERLADIPIVIASTEGSDERIRQLREFGAFGYVRKPFQPEKLRDLLKPLLGVQEHAAVSADTSPGSDLF